MKKKYLLIVLSILLISCNGKTNSSSTSSSASSSPITSSSSSIGVETKIYDFNDNLAQKDYIKHDFKTSNFKEYTGSLTPTNSDLLTFTLSDDGTYYIVSDKEHKLNTPNLVIPSEYNSLPVQEIADEAFAYKSWLNSVVIPSSIKKIGAGAFNSSSLKNIYYDAIEIAPLNAKNWIFYKGDSTQEIDIYFGKNVKKIPSRLFYPLATNPNETVNVKNVYFSKNSVVEEIGDYAFYKLNNVKNISLPNTIKSIGKYAFYECGISEIDLSNVSSIDNYAFSFSTIEYAKLSNLSYLGEGAFSYSNLKQIDLSKTKITLINNYTFKKCKQLSQILLNDKITKIGEEAFSYSNLKQFFAPVSLINIGLKSFYENKNLEDVKLNKNLKTINNYAFYNSINLKHLYIASDLEDLKYGNYIFVNAGKNASLQIAFLQGVNRIPANFMFSNANMEDNPVINELILPTSLKEIASSAFYDLSIDNIWYLGNEKNFKEIKIYDQNEILSNVKYAYVIK